VRTEEFLHFVVVAYEVEIERGSKALEKQSQVQAHAALVKVGSQPADAGAGMQVG
jgi:hypothetical protein